MHALSKHMFENVCLQVPNSRQHMKNSRQVATNKKFGPTLKAFWSVGSRFRLADNEFSWTTQVGGVPHKHLLFLFMQEADENPDWVTHELVVEPSSTHVFLQWFDKRHYSNANIYVKHHGTRNIARSDAYIDNNIESFVARTCSNRRTGNPFPSSGCAGFDLQKLIPNMSMTFASACRDVDPSHLIQIVKYNTTNLVWTKKALVLFKWIPLWQLSHELSSKNWS